MKTKSLLGLCLICSIFSLFLSPSFSVAQTKKKSIVSLAKSKKKPKPVPPPQLKVTCQQPLSLKLNLPTKPETNQTELSPYQIHVRFKSSSEVSWTLYFYAGELKEDPKLEKDLLASFESERTGEKHIYFVSNIQIPLTIAEFSALQKENGKITIFAKCYPIAEQETLTFNEIELQKK